MFSLFVLNLIFVRTLNLLFIPATPLASLSDTSLIKNKTYLKTDSFTSSSSKILSTVILNF